MPYLSALLFGRVTFAYLSFFIFLSNEKLLIFNILKEDFSLLPLF